MNIADERWVLRAEDQRALDERAVASGVGQDALMESAGTSAAEWILGWLRPRRAAVLAGPGGNGGDGLVVARRLYEAGVDVEAFLLSPLSNCSSAVRRTAERLVAAGAGPVRPASADRLAASLERADCVVDGLFGSGLTRRLDGEALRIVERLNASDAKTVSLDLPSGVASDRGGTLGEAVRADVTLAMAFLKPAHLFYPAAGQCGNTAVVDVAYPASILRDAEPWARVCEAAAIRRRLPARRPDGHKGTFGRVLVVAGSIGMTGAAILCCRGVLRAGAGLVYLAGPASLDPVFEATLPEVLTIPLPDEEGHVASLESARLRDVMQQADVLAVGPGLSRAPAALDAVRTIVERFPGPVVLDADGLHALVGREDVPARLSGRSILTPHPGELGALTGGTPERIDAERRDVARAFAREHGVVLVLKGRPTAIGLPEGDVYLNPTGNDGLATGGTGDVLTGLIAGFAAGGAPLADAALAGTYVHGLAAEIYARDRSARSLVPSDLIDRIPEALREVEGCG
jgi:hydroxyethylthiazole kinase-like uncharacterized protein yjeF